MAREAKTFYYTGSPTPAEREALGLPFHAQVSLMVHATTKKQAMEAFGVPPHRARDYMSEGITHPVAAAHPGRVIVRPCVPAHQSDKSKPQFVVREVQP